MLTLKLAFKNIAKAGLRTWLNVFVLSFAFVLIVGSQGIYEGMMRQMAGDMIDQEIGAGQFRDKNYDEYDAFTIDDSHSAVPQNVMGLIKKNEATPILYRSCAIFPNGRVQPAILKGIDPSQKVINIPSEVLENKNDDLIPCLIGSRMAKNTGLKKDDVFTVRWRDVYGTFDAMDLYVVDIMSTTLQSIDNGQVWIPLHTLENMIKAPGEATVITFRKDVKQISEVSGDWKYFDQDYLLKDVYKFISQKKMGGTILYGLLLAMALLAIFDTQVLAIFRRRKEMGTLMALGMTRGKVIQLFTLEGTMHGILAVLLGALYGIPLLAYFSSVGLQLPEAVDQAGLSISTNLYPVYTVQLFVVTSLILFISVLIVSFLPTRKIAKLRPTEALRGTTR